MQTSTSSRVRRYPYQITLSLVLEGFYSPSAPSYDFCLRRGISAREIPSRIASELIDVKLISLFFGWAGALGCITNKLTNNSFKASALRFRSFLRGFLGTI
ncbi:CIC_collapsed_G0050930.mRNA.1.CDS.1 [Saccharomyces cerevisiae]|nr:CIC_collapsed_G0050930.mRNA.1.CDS.1 [Saccharomyces cerevisiae]